MKTIPERLAALRFFMAQQGCDAYLLPSSDPHISEYTTDHFTAWEYFSGFQCENATLAVTKTEAALWIDGRFFGAADTALAGTGIQSMHMSVKGVPSVSEWLKAHLCAGQTVGYTAENISLKKLNDYRSGLEGAKISLKPATADSDAWGEDRPPLPNSSVWLLATEYAGKTVPEKFSLVRGELKSSDALLLSNLAEVAWLLNLRANDIANTPYALAFCFLTKDCTVLFIDDSRVPPEVSSALAAQGVQILPYSAAEETLRSWEKPQKVSFDPAATNAAFALAIGANPKFSLSEEKSPVSLLKAKKNEAELAATRTCHLYDGVAMVRFAMELEQLLASGAELSEADIDHILHTYRSSSPLFVEESFSTIAAYGPNAAMMHYAPKEGKDAKLQQKGFLLVDCGGTYLNGTTDITRTYALGPLTEAEKEMYTLVLKSHIDMAMFVWKQGMTGCQLDMIARRPFWKRKLDYRCGTGHSVSHVGAVHEGPHSLRPVNDVPFISGYVITDEPGYYEEGVMGIRIENELECVDAGESEYGQFLAFRPLTYVPIDLQPVIKSLLNEEEIEWLNHYHAQVFEKLSPLLSEKEREWLKKKCAAI